LVSGAESIGSKADASEIELIQSQIEAAADVTCQDYKDANERLCSSSERRTIWVFTLPAHPAHPATVQRKMKIHDSRLSIIRTGRYAGSEAEFRKWLAKFAELDRKQEKSWSARGSITGR
jgi:hypothetical protein